MSNLKHSSLKKSWNETNQFIEKYQENNQKEDKEICFTCNEEECDINAEGNDY